MLFLKLKIVFELKKCVAKTRIVKKIEIILFLFCFVIIFLRKKVQNI
jgi:hypothetical protein